MAKNYFELLTKDMDDVTLPSDLEAIEKIHCHLFMGQRIYWYYKEDLDFFEPQGLNIKDYKEDLYSGVCVGFPGTESNGGELEIFDAIVIIDKFPVEKEYPEVEWVTLGRLLDDQSLSEIFAE